MLSRPNSKVAALPWIRPKSCNLKRNVIQTTAVTIRTNEFLVSKETVVLRRWERSKHKFGFIKRVDKTKLLL